MFKISFLISFSNFIGLIEASLFYLIPIFLIFVFLFLFFSGQIVLSQNVDKNLRVLQDSVTYGNPSYEDYFKLVNTIKNKSVSVH